MAKKRIGIVGAGAVGAYAGAHMVQAGEDVTYIDPWPENVEAIRGEGLRVTHIRDVEPFTVKPRALHLTEAQQLAKEAPIDIAFVCMKSYDTGWATALIKQYLAPGAYVVSLQNCMNEETIAGIVGWGKTFGPRRRGRSGGAERDRRTSPCRGQSPRRRRASPVDGPGHGQGAAHRDPVSQRLCRARGREGRDLGTHERGVDRHRHPGRTRRIK